MTTTHTLDGITHQITTCDQCCGTGTRRRETEVRFANQHGQYERTQAILLDCRPCRGRGYTRTQQP